MTQIFIKSKKNRGEEREGSYAARAQIGTEKDGSPMYRYFDTMEQYKAYMDKKGKKNYSPGKKYEPSSKHREGEEKDDSLEEKVKKEHKESTEKVRENRRQATNKKLFVSTKKSLIYIR